MNHVEHRLAEVTDNFEYRARLILEGRDPDKQERFQKRIEELDKYIEIYFVLTLSTSVSINLKFKLKRL